MVKVHTRIKRLLGISSHTPGLSRKKFLRRTKKNFKKFKTEEAAKNWISKKKIKNYEIRKLKTGRIKVVVK